MLKQALLVCILLSSVVLISGCTQTAQTGTTGQITDKQAEDQAIATIDNELDQATANMSLDDIEGALLQ